jgi:hypothetical protein
MKVGKVLRVYVVEPIKIPVPSGRPQQPEDRRRPSLLRRR